VFKLLSLSFQRHCIQRVQACELEVSETLVALERNGVHESGIRRGFGDFLCCVECECDSSRWTTSTEGFPGPADGDLRRHTAAHRQQRPPGGLHMVRVRERDLQRHDDLELPIGAAPGADERDGESPEQHETLRVLHVAALGR
jgi:hypothetical protein